MSKYRIERFASILWGRPMSSRVSQVSQLP